MKLRVCTFDLVNTNGCLEIHLKLILCSFFVEMELNPYLDNDFYIKESRDMITVVQSMLIAGNKLIINIAIMVTQY